MNSQEFFLAMEQLENEKGIKREDFISALSNAISIAYKKKEGFSAPVEVRLDDNKKTIRFFAVRTVVEEVVDENKEISLEDAQEIKKSYKVGDEVVEEIISKDFGRICAGTARQVLLQKLREIEQNNNISDFEDKEGELMVATVQHIEDGNVYVALGDNGLEGVMMQKDQIPNEKYEVNQKINVFVKKVRATGKDSQIIVSRSSVGLVKRLFENEVPEIKQGIIEIKSVARDAGQRTKIAIASLDPQVDAIGACVGNKGARVNAIVGELNGEKIDIIPWSENPLEFIANALSPATVIKVSEIGDNSARAIVPDDKLSLAIGRGGQNARLAVKLTGWKIDVKSKSKAIEEFGEESVSTDVAEEIEEVAEEKAETEVKE